MIKLSLDVQTLSPITNQLIEADSRFAAHNPGDPVERQPVHSVYGGAHLFKAATAQKLGQLALRSLTESAPNFALFARALGLLGAETLPDSEAKATALAQGLADADPDFDNPVWQAYAIYQRVREKLSREPVEDLRVDFEDGYGYRPDDEEDGHALAVADQFAAGLAADSLPPFIGYRVKSFSVDSYPRAVRTLDLVLTRLAEQTGGRLPPRPATSRPLTRLILTPQPTLPDT